MQPSGDKGYIETYRQVRNILEDIRKGVFRPVYLLMGEEPYYPDMVCEAILKNCLQEWEKDFNEIVCYGADVDADTVITAARRFPMMAERQLVVVKEAQVMKTLEDLAVYCQKPLDSTVLVIVLHGATVDKRKALYKSVLKMGVVLESPALRDYEVPQWISSYYQERGLQIDPEAAQLLAEAVGTDLSTIAVETEKLLKNLPEGTVSVGSEDIEKNVGISRQFSVFELTRALAYGDAPKALKVAFHIGQAPRFAMPMGVSALFMYFYRILKYEALLRDNPKPDAGAKAKILAVNPFFYKEYEAAVRLYPLPRCMRIISLLNEYDYKGKGGASPETAPGELFVELVTKILNI